MQMHIVNEMWMAIAETRPIVINDRISGEERKGSLV